MSESNVEDVRAGASTIVAPPVMVDRSTVDGHGKQRRMNSDSDVHPSAASAIAAADAAAVWSASESEDESSSDDDETIDMSQVASGVVFKEKPRKPSHVIGHDAFRCIKREDEHHKKPLKIISRMRKNIPARACGRCTLCKEAPCGTCKNCVHNANAPAAGQKKQSKRRCLMLRCEKLKGMTGEQIAQQQNDPTIFKPGAEYKFLLSGLAAIDTMRLNAIKATQANYDDMSKYTFYRMYAECTEDFLNNLISRFSQDIAVDESTHKYMCRHVPYFMRQDYTIYNHDGRMAQAPAPTPAKATANIGAVAADPAAASVAAPARSTNEQV
jgi:hypothetical protein